MPEKLESAHLEKSRIVDGADWEGNIFDQRRGEASRKTYLVRARLARRQNRGVQPGPRQLDLSARLQSDLDSGRTQDADSRADCLCRYVRQLDQRTASPGRSIGRPRDTRGARSIWIPVRA